MTLAYNIFTRIHSSRRLPKSLAIMRAFVILGILLSVTTLVISLCISNGFEKEYKKALLGFNSHLMIMPTGDYLDSGVAINQLRNFVHENKNEIIFAAKYNGYLNLWNFLKPSYLKLERYIAKDERAKKLTAFTKKLDLLEKRGVEDATPFLYKEGLAISNGKIVGMVLKGVEIDRWVQRKTITLNTTSSREKNSLYIGKALAKKLNNPSEAKLLFASKRGKELTLKMKIAGTFETGLYDFDSQFIIMNIDEMRKLFNLSSSDASGVEVMIDEPSKAKKIAEAFQRYSLGNYGVITWYELNKDIFEAISLEKKVFAIIMGLLVVVGSFNIVALTILMILYRRYDIALFKSLGMPSKVIRKIFFLGGAFAGVLGVVLGIVLSLLLSYVFTNYISFPLESEIYFLGKLPMQLSLIVLFGVALFAFLISLLTSLLASRQERGIDICKVLQER